MVMSREYKGKRGSLQYAHCDMTIPRTFRGISPNSVKERTKRVSQTSTLDIDFVYKIAAKCKFDRLYD
jgi:hypothetical protein